MKQINKNLPSAPAPLALRIDQQQAQRHLKYLGYSNKNVFLRFFYHSDDPRKNSDKGRKLNYLRWQEIEAYQRSGRGVYVVVNGTSGGHEDKEIKQCVAIFCEWDDRLVEEQLLHWETVGFLEPTFTVFSGDKSAQPYWVFDRPITVEQWRELQCLLIKVMGADPSNKNPSRVFRLAGGWHVKPGREPVRTEIVQDSGKKYAYEQVRQELLRLHSQQLSNLEQPTALLKLPQKSNLPTTSIPSPQYQHYEDIQIPVPQSVPLEVCLAKDSRSLLESGVGKGGRNTAGAKLARDLIGTANYLQAIAQLFDGDPRQLLEDYANRCSPPLPAPEVDAIWKSAHKDNPTPSCQTEGVEACIRAWYWKHYVKPERAAGKSNHRQYEQKISTVTTDSLSNGDSYILDAPSLLATVTSVTQILERGLSDWEEQAHLDAVRSQSGISKESFAQLVASLRCQSDEVLPVDVQQLDQLIEWKNVKLDFKGVFTHLAADLLHDGRVLNIDPIMLWQYLMPAILSLVGKKGNLDAGSHRIPAIVWACIVGESGIGKSRAEAVILAPLRAWQQAEYQRFKTEWTEYKQSQNQKKDGSLEPVQPPIPERKYLFEVATIQAVMRRLSEQGENGSLWARDEIAGLFKSLGQFTTKGEGEGLECLLPMWDGASSPVDRVMHEDSYHLDSSRLSIAGGLQPGVFRKIFSDPDDAQGIQARFLFALPKVQPAKRVKGYCRLSDKLPDFYRWVDAQFPAGDVTLSKAADARYTAVYEQIGQQAEAASSGAIRAWLRKLPGQLLRISLALHVIECYHEPHRPRHELQLDTLNRAVDLCRYYRSTFQVVQESVADTDGVSSILLKIWDMAATSPGGLTVRDAYRHIKALSRRAKELGRNVAAYTIDLYYQLEKMGRGMVQRNGRMVRFVIAANSPPTVSAGNGTDAVTEVTKPQIQTNQALTMSPNLRVSPVPNNPSLLDSGKPMAAEAETSALVEGQLPGNEEITTSFSLLEADEVSSELVPEGCNSGRGIELLSLSNEIDVMVDTTSFSHPPRTIEPSASSQLGSSSAQSIDNPELQVVGDTTNSTPIPPTKPTSLQQPAIAQNLAEQILLCSTWVEIAQLLNENGDALLAAAKEMTQQQRQGLTRLLIEHLCQSPADLNQVAWIPEKLRQRALKTLTFTIRRLADVAENVLDATWDLICGCRLEKVSSLGTPHEMWIFTTPDGNNLRAYPDAVEGIACYEE